MSPVTTHCVHSGFHFTDLFMAPDRYLIKIKKLRLFTGLIVAQLAGPALAAPDFITHWTQGNEVRWQFSPLTYHYSEDPNHKRVVMIGLERQHADASIDGAAFFTNSFGQPTLYIYPWGHTYQPMDGAKQLSLKWTAGFLYGYRAPYEDKVPLNFRGLSLALIPAVVYELNDGWRGQVNILGTAGLMFELSKPFH
ncbi:hypothetical protein GALL_536350 [mine drainage metagenome]|uniref:Sn-glycerol-3-phosphate transporter n=1 Tax=mine drainage metagenome TaxID=410659 RepID=A0A1J5P141_9ZZZZ